MVIVSGRLDLPWDAPLFTAAAQVLIFTASEAEPPETASRWDRPPRGLVDLVAALRHLRQERGIRALLCEGGPGLHGELRRRLVDELFLTIAPKLTGGEAPRILEGELPAVAELELAWLLEEDGELFARYRPTAPELALPGRQDPRGEDTMDFNPSPEVATLRERVLDFMDAEVYPVEREIMEALDAEVGPGVPYPQDPGRDPREGEDRGALEPLHARRALRARADELGVRAALRGDGPQPDGGGDGLQLLGAGHRQHGDPRRARDRPSSANAGWSRCWRGGSAPASR